MTSKQPRAIYYVVEGAGEFPYDMLRYDSAFPALESQSGKFEGHHWDEIRRVALGSHTASPFGSARRWESFGWRIVSPPTGFDNQYDAERFANAAVTAK